MDFSVNRRPRKNKKVGAFWLVQLMKDDFYLQRCSSAIELIVVATSDYGRKKKSDPCVHPVIRMISNFLHVTN